MNEEYLLAIEKRNRIGQFIKQLIAPTHSLYSPSTLYYFSSWVRWNHWDCKLSKSIPKGRELEPIWSVN